MKHIKEIKDTYVIAEIGCNHNGDTDLGLKMIDSAKECGADAVKFQFFSKDNLVTDELNRHVRTPVSHRTITVYLLPKIVIIKLWWR